MSGQPPTPDGVRTVPEFVMRLRSLQAWAGLSYRQIHRRVVRLRQVRGIPEHPSLDTVYRCLQPGRRRLDPELVVDIARVLLGDEAEAARWRQAYRVAHGQATDAAVVTVLDHLPDDTAHFTGRRTELTMLLATLLTTVDDGPAAVCVVEGMAGVGKTTLAIHAAHRLVQEGLGADLRLFVGLRGHDPDRAPADPVAVLDAVLRLLGCPPHEIQRLDIPARAARYRELLAGRQAVIVLDDAAGEDQVVPLLPDSRCCRAIVTSRRHLSGLPAARLPLDVFDPAEALELLSRVLGGDRVAAEADAAAGVAEFVGYLPLAVALVAARAKATPHWTLGDHLTRLVEYRASLAQEEGVKVALESSYGGLPPNRQRLLRLLALHPGRDLDAHAAAALGGTDLTSAQGHLFALVTDSLLLRRRPDRYEMHDLVRIFAAARARDVDPAHARREAMTRLLGYYRYVAANAGVRFAGGADPPLSLPVPDAPVPELVDRIAIVDWLERERPNLVAVALYAANHGEQWYTGELSRILYRYLDQASHHRDALILHGAASRALDGLERAAAMSRYAIGCARLGRLGEARRCLRRALVAARAGDDRFAEGRMLTNLGMVYQLIGGLDEAMARYRSALELFRAIDDQVRVGRALANIASVLTRRGRSAAAIEHLTTALTIARRCSDRSGEATAIGMLGIAAAAEGRYEDALDLDQQALAIFAELGHRIGVGLGHNQRGRVLLALGRHDEAVAAHQLALAIGQEIGYRECEMDALNGLGLALGQQGRLDDAVEQHAAALTLSEQSGSRWQQAHAHDGLAQARLAGGDRAAARRHWRRAQTLHTAMGTPDAERIAACLKGLDRAG